MLINFQIDLFYSSLRSSPTNECFYCRAKISKWRTQELPRRHMKLFDYHSVEDASRTHASDAIHNDSRRNLRYLVAQPRDG
jgi:hypothetical protein